MTTYLNLKIFEDMDPAAAAEVGRGTGQGVLLQLEVAQGHHEPQLDRQRGQPVAGEVKEGQLEVGQLDRNLLEMIPPQMKTPERREVADLDGKVGDLVAADVELHQAGHLADLLGQADQPVVVGHQALQVDQAAHRGWQIGQLVPAEKVGAN